MCMKREHSISMKVNGLTQQADKPKPHSLYFPVFYYYFLFVFSYSNTANTYSNTAYDILMPGGHRLPGSPLNVSPKLDWEYSPRPQQITPSNTVGDEFTVQSVMAVAASIGALI